MGSGGSVSSQPSEDEDVRASFRDILRREEKQERREELRNKWDTMREKGRARL